MACSSLTDPDFIFSPVHTHASQMLMLFGGYTAAHGTFRVLSFRDSDNKAVGEAVTKNEPLTVELWSDHLDGKHGLGVIPLDEQNNVKWGALNIDAFDFVGDEAVDGLYARIRGSGFPLIPCQSPSLGLHLFLFLSKAAPATLVRERMRALGAALGLGHADVWPRQVKVAIDRGERGQWLNMPYFDAQKGQRYALTLDRRPMDVAAFIEQARAKALTPEALEALPVPGAAVVDRVLPDGPPCLQILTEQGVSPGDAENVLYNVAVYMKQANPDNWRDQVREHNARFLHVQKFKMDDILHELRQPTATYTCRREPLCFQCNTQVCRLRKFGKGVVSLQPQFNSLTKLNTTPAIWFLGIEGSDVRLELSSIDLRDPKAVQAACIERLNITPPVMPAAVWHKALSVLMDKLQIIQAPPDSSPMGQFLQLLEKYVDGMAQAKNIGEINREKSFHDTENKRYIFRLSGIMQFLGRCDFHEFDRNQVVAALRSLEGKSEDVDIGKGPNRAVLAWIIDEGALATSQGKIPVVEPQPF